MIQKYTEEADLNQIGRLIVYLPKDLERRPDITGRAVISGVDAKLHGMSRLICVHSVCLGQPQKGR